MSDRTSLTRRKFAAALAAASAAPSLLAQQTPPAPEAGNTAAQLGTRKGTIADIPPFQAPLEYVRREVPLKVQPFPMQQVRLLPGIFQDAEEANRAYMQRLTEDRLVRNFVANAGLPTSAKPFGGWEQDNQTRDSELRGHFTGHFLSGTALLYASTGDREVKAKGDQMVADLAKVQEKLGAGGYLSAFPISWFDRLDRRAPVWAPFYTVHKIMAGMFDMYQAAGNQQALKVLEGMADWTDRWTASKSEEHMQSILTTEFGGMAETLYNLAGATGNDRWAKAGDRFSKKTFLNPLALRRDELRGLHTNTHIPQVIAAARRYELSGDMRFHDVADFFFDTVSTGRTYVTGGTSNDEGWLTQPRLLARELSISTATAECCCSYNMMKLARRLYSWNPDPRYFDYYERNLLNHRMGTIHPKTGHAQYYLSLTPGAWRTWGSEDQSFWCCTGSAVEEYSKLNDSIYWRDQQGLYVNLFIASELNWVEKGFRLRQETKFPEQPGTSFTVTAAQPVQLTMRLRIPGWLESAPTVKLNGKPLDASATPGSYLTLSRQWKTGDRVELELPMHLRVEAMPDDPKVQAFLYGPLVLAGDLGSDGLTDSAVNGIEGPTPDQHRIEVPSFRASSPNPSAWIVAGSKPLTFRTIGQKRDVDLAPFYTLLDKRYSVYWQVS